jgi:hypothetical protein
MQAVGWSLAVLVLAGCAMAPAPHKTDVPKRVRSSPVTVPAVGAQTPSAALSPPRVARQPPFLWREPPEQREGALLPVLGLRPRSRANPWSV